MGMIPLSEIAAAPMRPTDKLAALFNPPAWWLHGFYGVPPGGLVARLPHRPTPSDCRALAGQAYERGHGCFFTSPEFRNIGRSAA